MQKTATIIHLDSIDGLTPLGCVERLAFGRGEDDVEHGALLGRELGFDQVGGPLRVGAGDLELVAQTSPHGRDEEDEHDDDADPRRHDAPRVGGTVAHPAGEPAGRQPLVPAHPTLGDVDSPEALADYQAGKRAHKAAMRAQSA